MSPIAVIGGALIVAALVGLFVALRPGGTDDTADLSDGTDAQADRSPGLRGIYEELAAFAEARLDRSGHGSKLNALLESGNSNLRAGEWVTMVGLWIFCAAVIALVFAGILGMVLAVGSLTVFFRWRLLRAVEGRRGDFAEQLPETLQIMAGSLRSGMSLLQTMEIVSREAQSPTGEEFKRVMAESRLGRDLGDSMRDMAERLGSEDFIWVVGAVEINREVGGDLAEILDRISHTIRQRERVRGQARALSAEGRMSGYTLLALPPIAFVILGFSNPAYVKVMTSTFLGLALFAVAGLLMFVGAMWMRKLIKIEV